MTPSVRRSASGALLGFLALFACASPAVLEAQLQDGCVFGDEGNDVFQRVTLPGGETIHYVTNPYFECADGVRIWADSAVAYSASSMTHLIGAVRYLDPTRVLRSDEARYFSNVGRLQAQGHVVVEDLDDGSVVENGDLIYLRATSFRPEETMTVTIAADGIRPRASMSVQPADSSASTASDVAGEADPLYVIVGDEIIFRGESGFISKGQVEIEQDSMLAFADSARYDSMFDLLSLRGAARVESSGYDLIGREIDVFSPGGANSEVRAVGEATLIGAAIQLSSQQIFMHLSEGSLNRLVAIPLPPDSLAAADSRDRTRPVAVTDDFELVADSLEVNAPGEVLHRVFAAGKARSVSSSRDSLNIESLPEIARTDWIEGDTIIFVFTAGVASSSPETEATEPSPEPQFAHDVPVDSAGRDNQIERIIAKRAARSLYRIPPADSTAEAGVDPPSLHFVVGDEITLLMSEGNVENMEVVGRTRGIHLEPFAVTQRADSASAPEPSPDSVPSAADTTSGTAPVDTLRVARRRSTLEGDAPGRSAVSLGRMARPHPPGPPIGRPRASRYAR